VEEKMKLKFKGTEGFETYQGDTGAWKDGEAKETPDDIAKGLLSSFPKNFSKAKDIAQEEEKGVSVTHDKSMKSEHDK